LEGELGVGLSDLQYLKIVNVSNNNLQSITPVVGLWKSLEQLSANTNSIGSIPNEIGQTTRLSVLEFNHNHLKVLPSEMELLKELQVLRMSENPGLEVSKDLWNLTNLKVVELSGISETTPVLGFNRMENLDLTSIQLSYFDASNNFIDVFPSYISQQTSLIVLVMSGNLFSTMGDDLSNLISLEEFYCESCVMLRVFTPPRSKALQVLNLKGCENINLLNVTGLESLQELHYSSPHLSPPSLEGLTNLQVIEVVGVYAMPPHEYPPNITSLTFLNCTYQQFGEGFLNGTYPSLSLLNFGFTDPRPTPHIFRRPHQFPSLKWFELHGSFTGTLPSELAFMTTLESLLISRTSLEGSIPTEYALLTNLRILEFLDNTNLTGSIPSNFGRFLNLEIISIEGNSFEPLLPLDLVNWNPTPSCQLSNDPLFECSTKELLGAHICNVQLMGTRLLERGSINLRVTRL